MQESKPNVWLGCDGGGTKTAIACIDGDTKQVLGRASAGSTNHNSVGAERASAALRQCIEQVLETSGVSVDQVKGMCIGASGCDRDSDKQLLKSWIQPILPSTHLTIINDAVVSLASGVEGKLYGVVIISGTGTITYGYNKNGESARASGWGPLLGDDGSGYQIGHEVLKAVVRASDGRGPITQLTNAVLTRLNLSDPQELIPWAYADTAWQRFADLAPLAAECAQKGDNVANNILDKQVDELMISLSAVVNKLNMSKLEYPLVLAGGNLTHKNSYLARKFIEKCSIAFPKVSILFPQLAPEVAAAYLAIELSQ